MKKTALLIIFITILSKVLGFGREVVLSYFYGASNISDAYLISQTIPGVVFSFVGAGLATGFIPMVIGIEGREGEQAGARFTSNLVNTTILAATCIMIGVIILAKPLVSLFASGFNEATLDMAVRFTRISAFGIYFVGLSYIFNGFLQVRGNYVIPALAGFPLNVLTILAIYLSYRTSIYVLVAGSVVAASAQPALSYSWLVKSGYRHRFGIDLKDKHLHRLLFLAMPIILGVSVNQINVLVDRTIASRLAVGGISALNYASRLNSFIQGIFVMAVVTVMYPVISKKFMADDMIGFKGTVNHMLGSISVMVAPLAAGAMILSSSIVTILFGRGAFTEEAIAMTSSALFYYAPGMLAIGMREVLSRAFYAMQDTRTAVKNGAIGVVLNIILNIILSRWLGIGGLALATSISALVTTLLLAISLRRHIGPLGFKKLALTEAKVLVAVVIMGLAAKWIYNILKASINPQAALIVAVGVGAIIYFATAYFMKIEDVNTLLVAAKKRLDKTN